GTAGGGAGAALRRVPAMPGLRRLGLEHRQPGARQGHRRSFSRHRARHRDGHQANGAHPRRRAVGAGAARDRRALGLARRRRRVRGGDDGAGGLRVAAAARADPAPAGCPAGPRPALGTVIFLVYAWVPTADPLGAALLAFFAGIGAYGWVGIYFIISAEAGGATQSGLLSGVSFAAIVIGLLAGAPTFGLVLQAFDSYGAS